MIPIKDPTESLIFIITLHSNTLTAMSVITRLIHSAVMAAAFGSLILKLLVPSGLAVVDKALISYL